MRILKNTGWILAGCLAIAPLRAAGPEFEVATIKPSPEITAELVRSGKLRMGMTIEHGRVDISGMPLEAILEAAFRTRHITGPDWMNARFDFVAKMPEGATEDQVPEMLQALLADRFKLTVHRETKDQPAYALVVAKGGIKAKEVPADAEVASLIPVDDKSGAPLPTQVAPLGGSLIRITRTPDGGGVISSPKTGGIRIMPQQGGRGLHLESPKITCAELATLLTELVNRQVVDMTETKSSYQISLDIAFEDIMAQAQAQAQAQGRGGAAPGQASPPMGSANPMGDAVVAAVQKIGLRLDSRKVPTEMIIVDHLEKTPSEN